MPKAIDHKMIHAALERYKTCGSVPLVSSETGISESVIYRELTKAGIQRDVMSKLQGKSHFRAKLTIAQRDALVAKYKAGVLTADLAREFGVSKASVRNSVKGLGGVMRNRGQTPEDLTGERITKACALWDEGKTQGEIAQAVGVNQTTVSRWIRNGDIPVSRRPRLSKVRLGDGAGIINSEGYQLIYRACVPEQYHTMMNGSGYIPMHRYVMALTLGRPLHKHETVHHIDGDKANNAAINLQLRHGKHGKGVVMCCAKCGSTDIIVKDL